MYEHVSRPRDPTFDPPGSLGRCPGAHGCKGPRHQAHVAVQACVRLYRTIERVDDVQACASHLPWLDAITLILDIYPRVGYLPRPVAAR